MQKWQEDVKEFMIMAGQACRETPGLPGENAVTSLELRGHLVLEEVLETLVAAGMGHEGLTAALKGLFKILLAQQNPEKFNLPEVIDGVVDSLYVLIGFAVECGVDLDEPWNRVHTANMLKAGGPRNEFGKIGKPPGWQAPDIAGELRKQGWGG